MDTNAKSIPTPLAAQGYQQLQAASKRVFSRDSNDAPYPVYTNAVEFTGMGIDIFMDVGTVSPESLQSALIASKSSSEVPPTVNFGVVYRFGMSLQTAIQLHQRLSEMIAATTSQLQAAEGNLALKKQSE